MHFFQILICWFVEMAIYNYNGTEIISCFICEQVISEPYLRRHGNILASMDKFAGPQDTVSIYIDRNLE